jgi:hypothetical protein
MDDCSFETAMDLRIIAVELWHCLEDRAEHSERRDR